MREPSSSRGPAAFAMRHARAIGLIVAGFCFWGLAALFTLPSGIYPNVKFPRITVIAERGEDAVENMQVAVTRPIEDAVNAVEGLARVEAKSIRGASELTLNFMPSTDMREALAQTRARATAAVGTLQPPVDLTIEQQSPSIFPVISFNVSLNTTSTQGRIRDCAALYDWAMLSVKPRISRLPDVFRVTVQGADVRQITVEANPARLAASGLTLDDVAKAIGEANEIDAVGVLEKNYKQYQILASSELRQTDDLLKIALATRGGQTIRLGDVARIGIGAADHTAVVTGNGKDSVVVSVFMRYGGKITALSKNVKATLEEIKQAMPPEVSITPVYDQADLVLASMGGVRDAIIVGVLLTIVVLWVFLRSWRLTVVAAISIPISMLGTFAILWVLGESLNLMSMGGIAVAIGLIIDDAIVVVENIARKIRGQAQRGRAIIQATNEILGAVVGSSLTTVVVFLPLVYLEGVVGQFFRALAVALALGIMVSLAVSLTLTPLMTVGRLGPRPGDVTSRKWVEGLASLYEWVARRLLRRPWLSALAIFLILLAGAIFDGHEFIFPKAQTAAEAKAEKGDEAKGNAAAQAAQPADEKSGGEAAEGKPKDAKPEAEDKADDGDEEPDNGSLKFGFLPEMDEGAFVLDYLLPVGSSLTETDKDCRKIEAILARVPEVASFSRRTGMELGFFATEQYTGDFLVGLKPFGERKRSCEEVINDLGNRIKHQIPQLEVEFVQVMQDTLNDMAGNPEPLDVKVFGNDYRVIQDVAERLAKGLEARESDGVVSVQSGVSFGAPEMTYRIDTTAASRLGLTSADIEKQLRTALLGAKATELRQGERLVPVMVRYPDSYRKNTQWLANLPLADSAGKMIPASLVSRLEERAATNELARENQQPKVSVTANKRGIDLGKLERVAREVIAQTPHPPEVHVEVGGLIESQKKAFENMQKVLLLACGLVFLLLVIQFRSYRLPFIIFLTLPPSQIGALAALKLTGTALNISSCMGLVMLIGLVVKNGIIFIEYTAQLRKQGEPSLAEALVHAGRVRLRPILMTTLAAIIAMVPLALNPGAGAELQRPLAIAVIGGLSVSTLFTLMIIPVAHLILGEPEAPPEFLEEGE